MGWEQDLSDASARLDRATRLGDAALIAVRLLAEAHRAGRFSETGATWDDLVVLMGGIIDWARAEMRDALAAAGTPAEAVEGGSPK